MDEGELQIETIGDGGSTGWEALVLVYEIGVETEIKTKVKINMSRGKLWEKRTA